MDSFICTACGTQYTPSSVAPRQCAICEEERQYVPPGGQTWTTLGALAAGHFNSYRQYEPGVIGIGTQPPFAIGQRALLVCTPSGNVLWDCIAMLDPATVTLINGLGGLKAIAISHPHFYTTMVEWSRAFGDVPIHLHAADQRWIMRPDPSIQLWNEETLQLLPDVALIRCGGHFPGGTVLHWAKGAGGRGVLVLVGHRDGNHRPKVPQFHAQLSKFDPPLRRASHWNCPRAGICSIRYDLRALFRSRHSNRRKTHLGELREALCRRGRRRL